MRRRDDWRRLGGRRGRRRRGGRLRCLRGNRRRRRGGQRSKWGASFGPRRSRIRGDDRRRVTAFEIENCGRPVPHGARHAGAVGHRSRGRLTTAAGARFIRDLRLRAHRRECGRLEPDRDGPSPRDAGLGESPPKLLFCLISIDAIDGALEYDSRRLDCVHRVTQSCIWPVKHRPFALGAHGRAMRSSPSPKTDAMATSRKTPW